MKLVRYFRFTTTNNGFGDYTAEAQRTQRKGFLRKNISELSALRASAVNLFPKHPNKSIASVIWLMLSLFAHSVHADWKSDWEKVVAAAKKEGQLNLYVGRYGQAALLDEFKKEPLLKIEWVT